MTKIEKKLEQTIDLTLFRTPRVLVVDDERSILRSIQRMFRTEPIELTCTTSPREALEFLSNEPFTVIISDHRMPEISGTEFLEQARVLSPESIRIMLTAEQDVKTAIDAINRSDVYKFIQKPWNDDDLLSTVRRAVAEHMTSVGASQLPTVFGDLLEARDEKELFQIASTLLIEDFEMSNLAISFFLAENGRFSLRHSANGPDASPSFHGNFSEFVNVIREGKPIFNPETQELLIPIQGPKFVQGIIQASLTLTLNPDSEDSKVNSQNQLLVQCARVLGPLVANFQNLNQLKDRSETDSLTATKNRQYLDEHLQKEYSRSRRYGTPFSLIVLDLDKFKPINDEHGHATGDLVLQNVADLLVKKCRFSDVVCRYGGDEFVILLLETNLADAIKKADIICKSVQALLIESPNQDLLNISCSIGISTVTKNTNSADKLFQDADKALYESKSKGRGRVSFTCGDFIETMESYKAI